MLQARREGTRQLVARPRCPRRLRAHEDRVPRHARPVHGIQDPVGPLEREEGCCQGWTSTIARQALKCLLAILSFRAQLYISKIDTY